MVIIDEQNPRPHSKEQLAMMLKKGTLSHELMETFIEAKNWWYHNAKEVIQDNRSMNEGAEL